MKKILFTVLFYLLIFSCYSQVSPPASKIDHEYEKDQFLIKAKKQKSAAWICLGGGVALFTTGILLAAPKMSEEVLWGIIPIEPAVQESYTGESILVIAGAAAVVTSIPLFIASGNNRHKARLLITSQKAAFISPVAVSKNVTGLTLSVTL